MNNEYLINDILDDELYEYLCEFENYDFDDEDGSEKAEDNRYWKSCVEDIDGGDNFIDYCTYFFGMLEEEGYYD